MTQLVIFRRIMLIVFIWILGEINKNKLLSEVVKKET